MSVIIVETGGKMLVPPSDMYWVMTEFQNHHAEAKRLYDRWRHATFRLWAHQDMVASDRVAPLEEYLEAMSDNTIGES